MIDPKQILDACVDGSASKQQSLNTKKLRLWVDLKSLLLDFGRGRTPPETVFDMIADPREHKRLGYRLAGGLSSWLFSWSKQWRAVKLYIPIANKSDFNDVEWSLWPMLAVFASSDFLSSFLVTLQKYIQEWKAAISERIVSQGLEKVLMSKAQRRRMRDAHSRARRQNAVPSATASRDTLRMESEAEQPSAADLAQVIDISLDTHIGSCLYQMQTDIDQLRYRSDIIVLTRDPFLCGLDGVSVSWLPSSAYLGNPKSLKWDTLVQSNLQQRAMALRMYCVAYMSGLHFPIMNEIQASAPEGKTSHLTPQALASLVSLYFDRDLRQRLSALLCVHQERITEHDVVGLPPAYVAGSQQLTKTQLSRLRGMQMSRSQSKLPCQSHYTPEEMEAFRQRRKLWFQCEQTTQSSHVLDWQPHLWHRKDISGRTRPPIPTKFRTRGVLLIKAVTHTMSDTF